MRVPRLARAATAAVVLVLALGGSALAAPEDATARTFYLRNDGTDCGAASHPFLAAVAGKTDLGCGYVGGGPFGEVFGAAGVDTSKVYITETEMSLTLDASRNVGGKVTITPYVKSGNSGSGVGQVTVDVVASATNAAGDQLDLGAASTTVTSTPVQSRQEVPINIDIPDALDGADVTGLSLTVNVRGVHVAHGFTELNGSSLITVPFQPAVVTPSA